MRQILLLSLLIFTANQLWAQPVNDNWQNAIEIKIAKDGFAVDTFQAPFVSMRNASTEIAETFHPIIRTLALDQKSVWYKFELKTNRKVELKMLQKDTLIQPLDVGMTVYKTNSGAPLVSKYTSYGYPTLTQIGAYTSVFTPGIYYIQVLSRKNVVDSIGLQLAILKHDIYGNSLQNPVTSNSDERVLSNELSIDSLEERKPFDLDTITKSLYYVFKTSSIFDRLNVDISYNTMAVVLYEMGIGNDPNDWKILKVAPYGRKGEYYSWDFLCDEIKPNTKYLLKFLGSENDYFNFPKIKEYGNGKASGSDPVSDLKQINLDWTRSYCDTTLFENFKCTNQNALKICNNFKHYLKDTFTYTYLDSSVTPEQFKEVHIPFVNKAGWWQTLEVKHAMHITLSNNTLLFKGRAKYNICELGAPIDSVYKYCMQPGDTYTLLTFASKDSFSRYGEVIINNNIGRNIECKLRYYFILNTVKKAVFYKIEKAEDLGEIKTSFSKTYTTTSLETEWLNGRNDTTIIDKDTLIGSSSFTKFTLKDSAYLGYRFNTSSQISGNRSIAFNIYKVENAAQNKIFKKYETQHKPYAGEAEYTKDKCSPGDYLMVFNAPYQEYDSCSNSSNYLRDGFLFIRDKIDIIVPPDDTNKVRCAHPYYAAKLAYKVNKMNPLDHNYLNPKNQKKGYYILPNLCTKESFSTLDNPILFNYQKYKNRIDGFFYCVFTIDQIKAITISIGTDFQLIKGDISMDSNIATPNNILLEYGTSYYNCALPKGTYSIIGIEKGSPVDGSILVVESGYSSKNDFIRLAQDVGTLSKTRTKAIISGVHSCKTTSTLADNKDTWHTFQLNEPGRLSIYKGGVRIYAATNGNELTFDKVKKLGLVDSTFDNLQSQTLGYNSDTTYFIKRNYKKQRFYIQYVSFSEQYFSYTKEVFFQFDPLTSSKGDSCENAITINVNGLGSHEFKANVNMHTLGEGPNETEASNLWLNNIDYFKTTWFKIEAKNIMGSELQLGGKLNGTSSAFRLHYGNCKSLNPGAVSELSHSNFNKINLDCITDGSYYIQYFSTKNTDKPNIKFPFAINSAGGPCRKIDMNKVLANFTSEGGCPNTAVNYTNLSTWGDNMKYIWDFGDGTAPSQEINPTHKYPFTSSLDTYSVQLIAINKINKRSDTISRKIVVGQLDASILGDTLICNLVGTLKAKMNNVAYAWRFSLSDYDANNPMSTSKNFEFNLRETKWIFLETTLANCKQLDSIKVYKAEDFDFLPKGNVICPNDDKLLLVNPLHQSGFTIYDANNNLVDSFEFNRSGTYHFTTYLNGKECSNGLQFQIDTFYSPNLNIGVPCQNDEIAKGLKSTFWLLDEGDKQFNTRFKHEPGIKEYYFKYMREDSLCSWQYDTVRIDSFIRMPILLNDTILCADDSLKIDLSNYDLSNFSWLNNSSNDTIKIINETGRYMLKMTKDECGFADTFIVTKEKDLSIHLANQQLCFQDEEANLNITGFDSLYWYNGSNNPEQIFSKEGTYWLQAFKNGCVVSDTFTLTNYCEPKLFIPNAFSPNGDAENPVFIAKGDKIQKFQMRIYNRDGALIFYTDDINEGWDGRIKNLDAPMASYYYVVEYSTEQGDFVKSGNLLLLR